MSGSTPPTSDLITNALKKAGLLPGGSGPNTAHPIGVPDNYSVDRTKYTGKGPKGRLGRPVDYKQSPYYHDGFQYQPAAWSPEDRYQLQLYLIQAGLLDPRQYSPSQWDEASVGAFKDLLTEANSSASHWRDTLNYRLDLAQQGLIKIKGSQDRQPLTVQLSSPADIKTALDAKAPDLLGRALHPDEQDMFVAQYHDLERQTQEQAYNTADTGGTVTQAPSLSSFIDQQIKDKYKGEYQANQMGENGLYFLKMLAQGAPQVGLPGVQS